MLTTSHSHPGYASGGGAQTPVALKKRNPWSPPNVWVAFSWMMTCCCPGFCLAGIVKGGAGPQQAWREKVALCWIVFFMSAFVAFFILAFNKLLCPTSKLENNNVPVSIYGGVMVRGTMFNILNATKPYNTLFSDLAVAFPGIDVTTQFSQPSSEYTQCVGLSNSWATVNYTCEADNTCIDVRHLMYPDQSVMGIYPYNKTSDGTALKPNPLLSWSIVKARGLVVYKDIVLNFQPYLQQHPVPDLTDDVDIMIRTASAINDATHLVARNPNLKDSQTIACLSQKYYAGQLDILPSECMTSLVVTYMATALVLSIVIVRFVMAVVFNWFIANKLSRKPKPDSLREREYYEKQPTVPFLRKIEQEEFVAAGGGAHGKRVSAISAVSAGSSQRNLLRKSAASPFIPTAAGAYDTDLHTVLLVTCYSEGEQSMRNTLESLVATDYHDEKKLLFVICDGVITGKGEAQSTPDIVLGLIELDDDLGGNPKPYSYVAVASGSKQHNMAKVYCGNYVFKGRAVPTVVVVKCGTPAEASSAKPGNRGKRDSQLILMNFFSRVVLQDRMTPLDYDMFRKIHHITGFTPDYYEILLMVDADTMVHPDSLRAMTNCMYNNPMVMGLCGETKIDNKRTSWVTMIQVFEYYISHHLGKAFESVFGGVTCLPGCFCMYRIKARKGDEWIPIVVAPDIVSEYSTNEVETLHQKNLLLLGEDRFLTTLMLRQFPKRKQVFVPGAICRTTVPDDFKTLLSQRRRWINSTIHNLMELVLLRDLCGTFCFSMQFIVLMDLIGTAILPISLLLLYYMIYVAIFQTHYVASEAATYSNTILLVGVLFMPAFLVVLVSRKMSLIMWMLLYLVALPIWQFVLPLYAFWNFDDFSWGATRQVAGAGKDTGHGESGGADDRFDPASVPFRKWEEYEVEWRQRVNTQRLAIKRAADAAAAGGRDSPALSVPSSGYHHGAPRLRSRLSGLSLGTTMTDGTVDSASASPFEDIDFE
ncbi:chitin synthase-domain-containing protein [Zopfochytrium polystomum]|nr:chitin synthase-domain-containing protein [Zopfochytrium polystomum]